MLNDKSKSVYSVFKVFSDPDKFVEFYRKVVFIPLSRGEYCRFVDMYRNGVDDIVWRAISWITCCNQIFCGVLEFASPRRKKFDKLWVSRLSGTITSRSPLRLYSNLVSIKNRLDGVVVENLDALDCIRKWDNPNAVFYVDPPYLIRGVDGDRKDSGNAYEVEVDSEHHKKLVELLLNVKGAVVLSCYWDDVYFPLVESGWVRSDFVLPCFTVPWGRKTSLYGKSRKEKVSRTETILRNSRALDLNGEFCTR